MPTNREAQNWLNWKQATQAAKLQAAHQAKVMAVMKKPERNGLTLPK